MDVTNFCNLRCIMCYFTYAEIKPEFMDMDLFNKIAEEIFPKTRVLILSWATEPILHKNIAEMLSITKKKYKIPQVSIVTNGTLITNELAEKLTSGILDKLYVSIDAATKQTYEEIRVGSKFGRFIENLEYLNDYKQKHNLKKPRLVFNFVMMNRNISELPDYINLVHKLGGKEINAWGMEIQPEYLALVEKLKNGLINEKDKRLIEGLNLNDETISLQDKKVIEAIIEAQNRAMKFGIYLYAPRVSNNSFGRWKWLLRKIYGKIINMEPYSMVSFLANMLILKITNPKIICYEPWNRMVIYSNGDVQPCCRWSLQPLGSFRNQSFEETWNGQAYKKLRKTLAIGKPLNLCKNCIINIKARTS